MLQSTLHVEPVPVRPEVLPLILHRREWCAVSCERSDSEQICCWASLKTAAFMTGGYLYRWCTSDGPECLVHVSQPCCMG